MTTALAPSLRGTVLAYADEPLLRRCLWSALQAQCITSADLCGVNEHFDEYRDARRGERVGDDGPDVVRSGGQLRPDQT